MTRGKFIVFEGGEGTGKSTQSRLLHAALEKRGIACRWTREPGGTPGAEAIRELLLHPAGPGWGMRAEALLFAAARSDHVEQLIRPALVKGEWVVCDRFLDSSRAYQGVAGELGDAAVCALHEQGSQGLLPDMTLVIDASEATIAKRLAERDGEVSDAIGGRDAAYHAKVNAAFLDFARQEPQRFAVVDGDGSIEDVHRRIMTALATVLEEKP